MISITDLTVAFGGTVLLNDISLHISEKDRIGLTGRNGAGKSTLLKLIVGEQHPTEGKVMVPQGFPGVEGHVMDSEAWWTVLDSFNGWKLEKNKVTGHCRVIDPDKLRKAWGREAEMRAAFEKVVRQLVK